MVGESETAYLWRMFLEANRKRIFLTCKVHAVVRNSLFTLRLICFAAGSVDPESVQPITESEMVQLTDDFLQGRWNPHNIASPINAKYVMRERLPALTFVERKTIVAQREVLDWKVRSLACSVLLYVPHFSPVQRAAVIGESSTQR